MLLLFEFLSLLLFISKCRAGLADMNLVNTLSQVSTRPLENLVEKTPSFQETAARDGYKAEEYEVTTEDGYILKIFRLISEKKCAKKVPVLLMHGFLQAAECYIDSGPEAPAYCFLNDCYDVWLGNFRGTYNSRKHVTLNPDTDKKFWQFYLEELGKYDLPAIIDFVLDKTNSKQLIYVGYSQGGGSYFVLNSERPEYAEKIRLFVGLAPASRLTHATSIPIRALWAGSLKFRVPLEALGVSEVLSKGFPLSLLITLLCQLDPVSLCPVVTRAIDTLHFDSVPVETQKRIFQHVPAGLSLLILAYYGQVLTTPFFNKFDYGADENLRLYGTPTPPDYNFNACKAPSVIFHGSGDTLVDTRDIVWAVKQLPNVLEFITVKDPKWNHVDTLYSLLWNQTIYAPLKKYLEKYSYDDDDSSDA